MSCSSFNIWKGEATLFVNQVDRKAAQVKQMTKEHKILTALVTVCLAIVLMWIGCGYMRVSELRSWFQAKPGKRITMLQLETSGGVVTLTNAMILDDLNSGVRKLSLSPGPLGWDRAYFVAKMNSGIKGTLLIGCSTNSSIIGVGVAEEYSLRPDFVYGSIEVGEESARKLHEIICESNSSK